MSFRPRNPLSLAGTEWQCQGGAWYLGFNRAGCAAWHPSSPRRTGEVITSNGLFLLQCVSGPPQGTRLLHLRRVRPVISRRSLARRWWLALGLVREGRGLNHVGYAFLSFYKILETAFPKERGTRRSRAIGWGGLCKPRAMTANSAPPMDGVALLRPRQLVLPDPIGLCGISSNDPWHRITGH
jgi:hypothetical protein